MSAYKKYWISTIVNLERGKNYFIYWGYIIKFGKQWRMCFDTKSPSETLFQNGAGENHKKGFFAWQTGSPVHDTCSDFIQRDFL